MKKLILATRNRGKIAEMRSLLDEFGIETISALDLNGAPEVEEIENTLEGNARRKAVALYQHTGLPSLADDTGLEVAVLNGVPGVHSARYAGPEADDAANRFRLLNELQNIGDRRARFRTVIAFAEKGQVLFFEGVCNGFISNLERGSGGFGYDPLFIPEGDSRTFAELSPEEKNAISHRGRAIQRFIDFIKEQAGRQT